MKVVLLLLNTERFSVPLIRYLILEGRRYGWKTYIGSMFEDSIIDRIKTQKFSKDLGFIKIRDFHQCDHAIRKSDLVIGMVPEIMLHQIIDSCIKHRKTLVSPSRINQRISVKKTLAEENETLLLLECGFTPGLDHITAKKAIDSIHAYNGKILEFRTYSGSLVNDCTNPWKYKLTEPASEIIDLGRYNNSHIISNKVQNVPYQHLFERAKPVILNGCLDIAAIPEGDSMYYQTLYDLNECNTVIKSKLLHKDFVEIWRLVVKLGLTDNVSKVHLKEKSFYRFLESLLPYSPTKSLDKLLRDCTDATQDDIEKLRWLGLFDSGWIYSNHDFTPADVLQHLMEKKLALDAQEQDSIIMMHHLVYQYQGKIYDFIATFNGKGENQRDSAIAKAIGIVSGAAAKACLLENIKEKGLHVPIQKEIYDSMLQELDDLGVAFHIEKNTRFTAINDLADMALKNSKHN
jgi:saccharopine dehydrogenase-like NADP-dependent oxidoreductase